MFRKNVAGQFVGFQLNSATTGLGVAGATVTANICIDGAGAYSAAGGTTTSLGGGGYVFALAQADTNGNDITIQFSATGCITVEKTFVTTACNPTVATNFGITSLPTTAVTTNASLLTSGAGTDQLSVSAGKTLLQATQTGVTIPTVTTVTNQLTAAAIATGVWQDTTSTDFTTASSIGKSLFTGVAPGASGGVVIAGTNAGATSFTAGLTISNASGSALTLSSSGGNGSGLNATGNGSGSGINTTGGATGHGLMCNGGATSGNGIYGLGTATGNGIAAQGGSTSGNGMRIGTNATNNDALVFVGNGTGAGITAQGGATGVGIKVLGGATSGAGITVATTSGDGFNLTGVTAGTGINSTVSFAPAIASAVWQDTTAGDFTTASSPGKIIFTQLGGAFTTTSSSVFSVAALANGPSGSGSSPASIATAVWQDLTSSSDFSTAGSIGLLLKTNINAQLSTLST